MSKNVDFIAEEMPPVTIMAHADSIRPLLCNLIENALRYTEQGSVTVSLEDKGSHVNFVVQDTGIGIPSESLHRIFERFYRVDKSRSRLVGGSGLGLSIAKAIVDAHKGSINAESTVGKGTRITVTLPLES